MPLVKWLVGLKLQTALIAYQGNFGVYDFFHFSFLSVHAFHKGCRFRLCDHCGQPLGIYKICVNRHLVSLLMNVGSKIRY